MEVVDDVIAVVGALGVERFFAVGYSLGSDRGPVAGSPSDEWQGWSCAAAGCRRAMSAGRHLGRPTAV
jgi:pimeloyl-ACP methyl ester carboxylesterase